MNRIIGQGDTSMNIPFQKLALVAILLILLPCIQAAARTIQFAGHEWKVREGQGGPGPNRWSDSEESAWVDDKGLHLRIRKIGDQWHCAEVTTVEPARYGTYRFYLSSRVDRLDKNVVAAPFLYANDTKEIDIEFSTWGKSGPRAQYGQYVVQPYNRKGNLHRFNITLEGDASTHSFDWSADRIRFLSLHGHYADPPSKDHVIQEWSYTGDDNPIEEDGLKVHINFWLVGGKSPSDGRDVEIVIKNVDLPIRPEN